MCKHVHVWKHCVCTCVGGGEGAVSLSEHARVEALYVTAQVRVSERTCMCMWEVGVNVQTYTCGHTACTGERARACGKEAEPVCEHRCSSRVYLRVHRPCGPLVGHVLPGLGEGRTCPPPRTHAPPAVTTGLPGLSELGEKPGGRLGPHPHPVPPQWGAARCSWGNRGTGTQKRDPGILLGAHPPFQPPAQPGAEPRWGGAVQTAPSLGLWPAATSPPPCSFGSCFLTNERCPNCWKLISAGGVGAVQWGRDNASPHPPQAVPSCSRQRPGTTSAPGEVWESAGGAGGAWPSWLGQDGVGGRIQPLTPGGWRCCCIQSCLGAGGPHSGALKTWDTCTCARVGIHAHARVCVRVSAWAGMCVLVPAWVLVPTCPCVRACVRMCTWVPACERAAPSWHLADPAWSRALGLPQTLEP